MSLACIKNINIRCYISLNFFCSALQVSLPATHLFVYEFFLLSCCDISHLLYACATCAITHLYDDGNIFNGLNCMHLCRDNRIFVTDEKWNFWKKQQQETLDLWYGTLQDSKSLFPHKKNLSFFLSFWMIIAFSLYELFLAQLPRNTHIIWESQSRNRA